MQRQDIRLLEAQAEKIPEGQKKVCIFDSKLSGNEPRELMNLVLKKGTEVCAYLQETKRVDTVM